MWQDQSTKDAPYEGMGTQRNLLGLGSGGSGAQHKQTSKSQKALNKAKSSQLLKYLSPVQTRQRKLH